MTLAESITRHLTQYLRDCLAQTGGNVTQSAKIAGVHRATFHNLCRRYEIDPEEARAAPSSPVSTSKLFARWSLPQRSNVSRT